MFLLMLGSRVHALRSAEAAAFLILYVSCVMHHTCLQADLPAPCRVFGVLQLVFFLPQLVQLLRDDRGKNE